MAVGRALRLREGLSQMYCGASSTDISGKAKSARPAKPRRRRSEPVPELWEAASADSAGCRAHAWQPCPRDRLVVLLTTLRGL